MFCITENHVFVHTKTTHPPSSSDENWKTLERQAVHRAFCFDSDNKSINTYLFLFTYIPFIRQIQSFNPGPKSVTNTIITTKVAFSCSDIC